MFKTLGSLVIAMTTVSALLGWIDPSQPAPGPVPSYPSLLADARGVVGDQVSIRPDRWNNVGVVSGPVTGASRLTAVADHIPSHFVVGPDGTFSRTVHWEHQEDIDDAPRTVTIEVASLAAGRPMTRAQWYAVRALIAAVTDLTAPGQPMMPMHLDADWARAYGVDPGESVVFDTAVTMSG